MTVWQMEGFGMITEMRHWAEAISKAYDMTAWGHTQRAAEILKQTRKRICAAIAEAEKQEPAPGYCKHCKQYTIEEPLPAQPATVQVSPTDFVDMVMDKEDAIGKPIFWAEWPNREKNT
jgi:hypothetical protein